ncbi:NAD-dependent epimerase/dehydratase family protein [Ensifer sp. 22521]|uniref:NAD-dependent epimerase/dehydratase family protein n=1 Tax=Ensifer sp. 22521 TaxID=3453935 RepID=UPI003F86C3FD
MKEDTLKRILVTGGAGFIGTHLVRKLVELEYDVVILDNLSSGKLAEIPQAAVFIEGSVLDSHAVQRALTEVDACIHLAAVASVEKCNKQLKLSHQTNITGFLCIVEEIVRSGKPIPLVYASSAAVYGGTEDLPLSEERRCIPLSPYGVDKLSCELHARAAYEVFGITTTGLRFFNVYGPGQDPLSPYSGVITKFAEQVTNGRDITIFGDGSQTRDFVYVDDIVEALIRAASAAATGANVINVCSGIETSINELAQAMISETNSRSKIEYHGNLAGEVKYSRGCVKNLRRTLNYECHTSLRDGLSLLLATFAKKSKSNE